MSVLVVCLFILFSSYLVTRFGHQILAKEATSWWFILIFLFIGVVKPSVYDHVASMLGIALVSNFVFAVMTLFLVKVSLEAAIRNTTTLRKLRDSVCFRAAEDFAARCRFQGSAPKPQVLILLPTYNEEANLKAVTASFAANAGRLSDHMQWSCCFVNDGSQDDTPKLLRELAPLAHTSHATNMGVSATLLTGFKAARTLGCTFVVQCDADGQHPVEKIPDLVLHAIAQQADLTIGSRYTPLKQPGEGAGSYRESTTFARRFGSYLIRMSLWSFGAKLDIHDPTSGFRVYSKRAVELLLRTLPDDYPEPESIALCTLNGLKVVEMPVQMAKRQGGETSISGAKSLEFMIKVFTALISLRIRNLRPLTAKL